LGTLPIELPADGLVEARVPTMTRAEAMRLMGIASQTAFRNRVRNHGIGTLVIGHASLATTAIFAQLRPW
jgi:hypothetical protein